MPYQQLHEFTEYESPDGEIYRFETGVDKFLISETGWGMPPVSYITSKSPLQHGETLHDYRLGVRVIQLVHRRNGCSRDEYWENRYDILDKLRMNRSLTTIEGILRKRFNDGSIREIKAVIEQGPEFVARDPSRWDEWSFTESLRFVCHDPIFYDPVQKSTSLVVASATGIYFPIDIPVVIDDDVMNVAIECVNAGTYDVHPTITLVGPLSGVRITNEESDAKLNITYNVSSGETLVITLDPGNKRAISDLVGDISGILWDSDISSFKMLAAPKAPSGSNTVRFLSSGVVTGGSDTAVSVSWYDRYIGL